MTTRTLLFLALLLLAGCRVEVAVDSSQGCIRLDGTLHCEDFVVNFAAGDVYTVTAVPEAGYTFSHWRKDHRYLFGENPDVSLRLDTSDLEAPLPDEIFYLEPVFIPECRADRLADAEDDYRWVNCRGQRQRANYSFADVLDVSVTHKVSVLFYVDLNRPELLEMSAEQFVNEQVELQNGALSRSGAKLRYEVAGVIPVDLPSTGQTRTRGVVEDMRDAVAPFEKITSDRNRHQADLVHTLLNYEYDGASCGYSYSGIITWDDRFAVGTTACFRTEGEKFAHILAHELGHSLGLAHDRPNRTNTPTFTFGYGWSSPGDPEQLGTVMSYASDILYFSTPERRMIDGLSGREYIVGDLDTDAVTAMNLVRLDYARLRPRSMDSPEAAHFLPGQPDAPEDCPTGPVR